MSELIKINLLPTHVMHYGFKDFNIDININNNNNNSIIVLMITGNPGEIAYYSEFMSHINRSTKLPLIGLSNGGHNRIPTTHSYPKISEKSDLYSLEGQIHHKMAFIEEFISTDSKLILIGHSIGCHVILEMLNRSENIASKVLHSVLIFPTIESLGETSEGRKYSFLFKWFKYPLLGLSYFMQLFSDQFKERIVSLALQRSIGFQESDLPKCVLKSAINLFDPNCLKALMHMSLLEFQTVKELNTEAIDKHKERLTFLYGEKDKWCPVEYYERITKLYPDVDIRLCLKDMDHAFVMQTESTKEVAQIVIDIINSVINQ